MKKILGILFLLFISNILFSQPWNQTFYDPRGLPVTVIKVSYNMGDIAKASYDANGYPVIYIHSSLFLYSWQAQYFVFSHEMAHHVLGHGMVNHPLTQEADADCTAIQYLFQQGFFSTRNDVTNAVTPIINSSGDWTHAPGQVRYAYILQCAGFND